KFAPGRPVTQAPGPLRLRPGVMQYAGLSPLDELGDAVALDVPLALEAELFLHLDLDPQALAVKPVLVPLPVAEHGVVPAEEVLVGAPPGVVHAHRVVGGDRPVEEGPAGGRGRVTGEVAGEDPATLPPVEQRTLMSGEHNAGVNCMDRHHDPPQHNSPHD